jgi:hypothetical protein
VPGTTPPTGIPYAARTWQDQAISRQQERSFRVISRKATLRERAFGDVLTPGEDRLPMVDVESMVEQSRRIRELERRVEELEKRIHKLEKK